MLNAAADMVLALPAVVRPTHHARSTLILASVATVRGLGRFDDYERALAPEQKDAILGALAGTWLPIEAAQAHYAACDTLGFTAEQQVQAGRATFDAARATLLGTAVRMARGVGVTPWTMLPHLQRFWERGFQGGAVQVERAGPKDAIVTLVECTVLSSPYFRNGLRGLVAALCGLSSTRAYATERRTRRQDAIEFRAQWA